MGEAGPTPRAAYGFVGLSTDLASRFAQVGSDTVYVSNGLFKPEFSADALDLFKGPFEPLFVRQRRWYPVLGSALLAHAHINAGY